MGLSAIRNMRRRPAAFGALFAAGISCPVLAFGAATISGVVRNVSSHDPIAGAVVVAAWEESSGGFGRGACPWIASATTDAHGRFEIPAPDGSFLQRLFASYNLKPYKSGFVYSPVSWDGRGARPPLDMVSADDPKRSQQEIRLMLAHADCLQAPISQAATLLPFYRSLLSDAIRLGTNSDDPVLLRLVCNAISSVGREDSQGTVGSTPMFMPGVGDPQEKLIFNRLEPRCLPITEPSRPLIRRMVRPNPSAGAPASTAPAADPSK
jgi:hypothetical protein